MLDLGAFFSLSSNSKNYFNRSKYSNFAIEGGINQYDIMRYC